MSMVRFLFHPCSKSAPFFEPCENKNIHTGTVPVLGFIPANAYIYKWLRINVDQWFIKSL